MEDLGLFSAGFNLNLNLQDLTCSRTSYSLGNGSKLINEKDRLMKRTLSFIDDLQVLCTDRQRYTTV